MSNRYVIEALLRPAVELNTAVVSGMAAYVCVQAPGINRTQATTRNAGCSGRCA